MFANLFRTMDLYKAIILLSCVATPTAALIGYNMQKQIETGRSALFAIERAGGVLTEIGTLQKQVEKQRAMARSESNENFRIYFERQITEAARSGLQRQDFQILSPNTQPVTVRAAAGGVGSNAVDMTVGIDFRRAGKDRWALPRDFLHAVILRIESGGTQVWKLRELKIANEESATPAYSRGGNKTPPPEVADNWIVETMTYVSREPAKDRR